MYFLIFDLTMKYTQNRICTNINFENFMGAQPQISWPPPRLLYTYLLLCCPCDKDHWQQCCVDQHV